MVNVTVNGTLAATAGVSIRHVPQAGWRRLPLIAGLLAGVLAADAATTINATHRHAYGVNIGWLNARGDVANGAVIGQTYCTGYVWSANCGWLGLGDGPANGWQYGNASAGDWGVNHDGAGRLSGRAYGANIGWVTFEQTYGKPTVDLLTGNLSGYAWGANVGWIRLSSAQAFVQTDTLDAGPDSDNDNIPDAYEYRRVGNLTTLQGGGHDHDLDGASNVNEYRADTDPDDAAESFRMTELQHAGDTHAVTWTVRPTRLYRLQRTDSLAGTPAWGDSGLGVLTPGPGPTRTGQVVEPGVTNRFYRAEAIVPLAP